MSHATAIDVEDMPALREVVETIRDSREPVVLRLAGRDIAVITPVEPSETEMEGVLTREQYDGLMSAVGGWAGIVDTEQLKRDHGEARGQAPRDRTP